MKWNHSTEILIIMPLMLWSLTQLKCNTHAHTVEYLTQTILISSFHLKKRDVSMSYLIHSNWLSEKIGGSHRGWHVSMAGGKCENYSCWKFISTLTFYFCGIALSSVVQNFMFYKWHLFKAALINILTWKRKIGVRKHNPLTKEPWNDHQTLTAERQVRQ